MVTAITVKEKIQGLIDKSNNTTGNSDTTLTDAVDALVEGYGTGSENLDAELAEQEALIDELKEKLANGGGDNTVVDVDVLPTENIDQSKIYRATAQGEEKAEVWLRLSTNEFAGSLQNYAHSVGQTETVVYFIVDEIPINPEEEPSGFLHIYIIRSTGEPYMWSRSGGLVPASDMFPVGYRGFISEPSEATEDGVYTMISSGETSIIYGIPDEDNNKVVYEHASAKGWARGGAKIKTLTATKNGTYDPTMSGLMVETITVDDTFPTYTSEVFPGMVFAKLSDIVLDNIEDYINADYSVNVVGLAEIPFSSLVYFDWAKAYTAEVVTVSNNDFALGFGATGVFVMVEMNGTPYQVSATIPRVIESADGYNPVVVSLPFETAATNGVKAHGANDESAFYVLTNDNRIFVLGSGSFTKTLAFYQVNAVSAYIGEGITVIGIATFADCGISELVLPSTMQELKLNSFMANTNLKTVTFKGTPTTVDTDAFNRCTAITDIYVPWTEGAVANAPWGATNATIHYNHTTETTA